MSMLWLLSIKNWCSPSCLFIFKIHVTQAGWVFFLLACIHVCLFINLLNCPWPSDQAKNYRPQIWYKNSPWAYLKTFFRFFFRKKLLRGSLASKIFRVTRIFRTSSFLLFPWKSVPIGGVCFLTFIKLNYTWKQK